MTLEIDLSDENTLSAALEGALKANELSHLAGRIVQDQNDLAYKLFSADDESTEVNVSVNALTLDEITSLGPYLLAAREYLLAAKTHAEKHKLILLEVDSLCSIDWRTININSSIIYDLAIVISDVETEEELQTFIEMVKDADKVLGTKYEQVKKLKANLSSDFLTV